MRLIKCCLCEAILRQQKVLQGRYFINRWCSEAESAVMHWVSAIIAQWLLSDFCKFDASIPQTALRLYAVNKVSSPDKSGQALQDFANAECSFTVCLLSNYQPEFWIRKWLEKPNFHNHRSKRSGDLWKICQQKPAWKAEHRKSPAFQAAGYLTIPSAGNASLACGYENQAFQAFCKKKSLSKTQVTNYRTITLYSVKFSMSKSVFYCLATCGAEVRSRSAVNQSKQ